MCPMRSPYWMLVVGGALGLDTTQGRDISRYVGVDICEYAIRMAKNEVLENKKVHEATFHVCDLCEFTPERDSVFDAIVFNEVLYYLDVTDAVVQLNRYLNWLSPRGIFCVSMKDDSKSKAVFRATLRRFEALRSVLFQASRHRVRYRIFKSRESRAYLISALRPIPNGLADRYE